LAQREPQGAKPEHTSCPDQAAPGCPDHKGTPGCPDQLGCIHGGVGLEIMFGGPAGDFPANIFEPGKISEKVSRANNNKKQAEK